MYRVYGDIYSGNCYKIKLLMSLLDIEHDWQHIDILKGESRNASFLEKNLNGKIPTLEIYNDDVESVYLTESNAILNYLADGTAYLPFDPISRARVLQWQFFEQYSHEPFIATSRFIMKYLGTPQDRQAELESKVQGGHHALTVMETQLDKTPYLVNDDYSIADISLFAYTHVAHEGGFSLQAYPNIRAWVERVSSQLNHISMADGDR